MMVPVPIVRPSFATSHRSPPSFACVPIVRVRHLKGSCGSGQDNLKRIDDAHTLKADMRMTITGPWGMREAEQLIRQVAAELVETLEPNSVQIVNEEIVGKSDEFEGTGFFNRQVEWHHEGKLALGTAPTKTQEAGPSRQLHTAWFGDDAGASWRRIYAACCKFSEGVTLTNDDCVLNARDMLYHHGDAGMTGWFLHQISGPFEPLAMTLYGDAMAQISEESGK